MMIESALVEIRFEDLAASCER